MGIPTVEIDSLSPLNVVYCGKLFPPLLFPLLPPDRTLYKLLLDLFYPLMLCCWAPGCGPLEGLVSIASDMPGYGVFQSAQAQNLAETFIFSVRQH